MKKRILFLTVAELFTESLGGSVLRATRIARYLAQKNALHIVHMCDKDPSKSRFTGSAFGDSHIAVPYTSLTYFLYSHALFKACDDVLKRCACDIVCAYFAQSGLYGMMMARKYHIPLVYFSDNLEYQKYIDFGRNDLRRFVLLPFIYAIERLSCQRADLMVPISETDAEVYRRWKKTGRTLVVPNGFDAEECNPYYEPRRNRRPTVLFFGHYRHLPNRDAVYAIRDTIMPGVAAEIPDVLFQFAGADAPTDVHDPHIEFLGFVDDIAEYVRNADIVIVPTTRGGGMKTKVVYALAFGKTTLCTPEGARGINTAYHNLHIAEIGDFPKRLCQLLRCAPQVDRTDAELIRRDLSFQSTLPMLEQAMDEIISFRQCTQRRAAQDS